MPVESRHKKLGREGKTSKQRHMAAGVVIAQEVVGVGIYAVLSHITLTGQRPKSVLTRVLTSADVILWSAAPDRDLWDSSASDSCLGTDILTSFAECVLIM